MPGRTLGWLATSLLPVFYSQEPGQTDSPSTEECDLKTCFPATLFWHLWQLLPFLWGVWLGKRANAPDASPPPVPLALGNARENGWDLAWLLPPHPTPSSDGEHTCRAYSLAASCGPTQFPSCPGLCIERKQMAQEFPGITSASDFQFQNMPTLCSPWILLPCWPGSSPVNHPYLPWKDRLRLLLLRLGVSLMLAVWLLYWVLLNFLFPGLAYKTCLINMLAHIQNIQTEKIEI